LWQNTPDLLLNDLAHLNQEGLEIYARNVRAAVGSQQNGTRTLRHQDKSAPGQSGTSIRQIGTCFFLLFYVQNFNSLEPIPNCNHVCSGKDPDHADSNPDPRSVIDEKKRLILLVMLMLALHNIMVFYLLIIVFKDYIPLFHTGAWGMDFVSSSPLFSTTPPFFNIFI
jgi:hypothetical protein